jgi:PTS system nitrogen regulatory IIA component
MNSESNASTTAVGASGAERPGGAPQIPVARWRQYSNGKGSGANADAPSNMNRLAKFLPIENVVLSLAVTSKKRIFEQAGLLFENQNGIARSIVTENLFARERFGSTGLGEGVAIPHGRIKGLKQPLAAFVRLAEPVPFESPDGKPVLLLIFLLVPEQATQQHLEILSEIAQLLSDAQTRERLATELDPLVIHRMLTQWEP